MGILRLRAAESCSPSSSSSSTGDKDFATVAAEDAGATAIDAPTAANDERDDQTPADLKNAAASACVAMPNEATPAAGEDVGRSAKMTKSESFFKRALSGGTADLLRSLELAGSFSSQPSVASLSSISESISKSCRNLKRAAGSDKSFIRPVTVKKLDREDIETGKLLGSGGFNYVYAVKNVRRPSLLGGNRDSIDCVASEQSQGNYVVKHLGPQVMEDEGRFRAAAVDLAHEAKLLSSIDHPNIVKLHGVTRGSIVSAFSSKDDAGYFLLLDKLTCTLEERIREWRKKEDVVKGTWREGRVLQRGLFPRSRPLLLLGHKSIRKMKRLSHASLLCRLDVVRQIALAMSFLHSQKIIFRDLKPGNIGFDNATGVAKVFDFGLSRKFPPGDSDQRLTCIAGTPRYMAPEMIRCERYGLSADVYSFGLLLWEICALKQPYRKLTPKELRDKVAYGTKRPKIRSRWPMAVRDLMGQCWDPDPAVRPEFGDIVTLLEEELNKNRSNHTV